MLITFINFRVEIVNLGSQGVDIGSVIENQEQVGTRPGINEIESSINNFPSILPQGTTSARPIGPELPPQLIPVQKVPSISNLPTTTPAPSPFVNNPAGFVPGTNIGRNSSLFLVINT